MGIARTPRDDVLNERLGSINDTVSAKLASLPATAESKADAEESKL